MCASRMGPGTRRVGSLPVWMASRELGKHYAKADHVQWWCEQIKERGSLETVYREIRKRQREYRDRDVG